MSKKLKAVSLQITNVLGINEITIDLSGQVTEISGRNGEGKTSCIEALKSVLTSAESATLLKNGATNGKAVLILNDGTQIISAFKPGKPSKRVMFGKDKMALGRSPTLIAGLFDAHSLNPVDFLTAKGKARIDLLLEAMPIELDLDRLEKICGSRITVFDETVDASIQPLGLIAEARRELYDLRTGDNGVKNDTDATIRTLQQSLASAQPFDGPRLMHCKANVKDIDGKLKKAITEIKQRHIVTKSACESAINKAVRIKQKYERACVELNNEIEAHKKSEENSLTLTKQQIKGSEGQSALNKSSINTEIELLEAAEKAFKSLETTRQSIKGMQEKVKKYADSADKLTGSIDSIDAYKAELLANMPIKGLAIEGDKLMLDGVIFDRVNTAKRVGVAMKLAELRAGKLKLILADGLIDIMDNDTREEFYRLANESDCQFVVTRVTDGALETTAPGAGYARNEKSSQDISKFYDGMVKNPVEDNEIPF